MITGPHTPPPSLDLQVNGYAGVDFNDDNLTLEQIERVCGTLRDEDVTGVLAAVVTADLDLMLGRIARLARFIETSADVGRTIWGIHVEGPFISDRDGFVGAHPPEHTSDASVDDAVRLVDAGRGHVRLLTLAPERDPGFAATRRLVDVGVAVSAGHTDASLDQLEGTADAGLGLFTHLGNGCPSRLDRHDNIIQRALALSDRIRPCFIADGGHAPFATLGNYLRCVGADRCIVVTDAIAAAGMGSGQYAIGEIPVDVGDDMVARYGDTGYLAGSCTTMRASAQYLADRLGLDDHTIRRMLWTNPCATVGLDDRRRDAAVEPKPAEV